VGGPGTGGARATAATPDGPHARARHGAAHASVHSPVTGLRLPERAAVTRRPGPARSLPAPGAATVVVAPGDTLWSIAAHGLPPDVADAVVVERWQAIYAANRGRIGPEPDLIVPGLLLHLPRKERP
jgi:resuscitation-promoting factor RpfA